MTEPQTIVEDPTKGHMAIDDFPDSIILSDRENNVLATNAALKENFPGCEHAPTVDILFRDMHDMLGSADHADTVVDAVLGSSLQFTDELHCETGKVFQRQTYLTAGGTVRLWILRNITEFSIKSSEADHARQVLEGQGARNAELAEELFHAKAELERQQEKLERLANTDPLTELMNRRCFMHMAQEKLSSLANSQMASVIMMDIDHFKLVNDTYGHKAGDEAIRTFANVLRDASTGLDRLAARLGGEEFALLLTKTDLPAATNVAETLRRAVEDMVTTVDGQSIRFTCSFGIAAVPPGSAQVDPALSLADKAMYEAKKSGRNRAVCA